jgi:membrane-associated phospholipid phosphatase
LEKAARIISVLFHPIFMPTAGTAILFYINPTLSYSVPEGIQKIIFLILGVFTIILPVLLILILLKKGYLKSLDMEDLGERKLPFLIAATSILIAYYFFKQLPIPRVFNVFLLGTIISVIMAMAISYRWKVSIHMIGMGGIAGFMMAMAQSLLSNLLLPISLWIMIAGLVGSSRLILGGHNPAQIYAGFGLGFVCLYPLISFLI